MTKGRLHAVVDTGYEEDPNIDPKVAEYLHLSETFELASEFDLIHSHYDFMALAYSRLVSTPMLTTIHGFSLAAHHGPCMRNTATVTSRLSAIPTARQA